MVYILLKAQNKSQREHRFKTEVNELRNVQEKYEKIDCDFLEWTNEQMKYA